MDIEFKDLEEKSYNEIVHIAKSIGVHVTTGKKESILKRIKHQIVKNNKKAKTPTKTKKQNNISKIKESEEELENNSIINNNNNNNKNNNNNIIQNENNNIDQQQELFWKVFKNKYINSIIFSFIKSSSFKNVYKYDQINNVEWMLKNAHYQLLRSKVLSSDYLTFNCIIERKASLKRKQYGSSTSNFDNIFYEYSIFNNPFKFDVEFHSKLLSNYSEYFNPTASTTPTTKTTRSRSSTRNTSGSNTGTLMDYLQMYAIEYDNVALLQVLIEEYGLIISDVVSLFSQCVDIGSVEIAYYLYTNIDIKITTIQMKSLWNKVLDTSDGWEILNKKVELFINRLKFKSSKTPIDSNLFNINIHEMSLKSIIECCQTIIYLEPYLKNNEINYTRFDKQLEFDAKLEIFKILTNDELNQIKSNYNYKEMNKLINEFSSSDENIKSLFNMLIIFTTSNVISDNFKFYKAKYYSTYYKQHTSNHEIKYYPYQFGDFNKEFPFSFSENNYDLFKFCKDDEKRKLFIKNYCRQGDLGRVNRYEVIKYFIDKDDIEMLEIVFKEFETIQKQEREEEKEEEVYGCSCLGFIFKSIKVFDFILNIFINSEPKPSLTKIQDQVKKLIIKSCQSDKKLEFSNYFKLNYPNQVNSCNDKLINITPIYYSEKDYAMYFFENWKDYENLPFEKLKELSTEIWTELPINIKLPVFKNLIENYYKLLLPKINHLFTENDLKYPIFRVSLKQKLKYQQISYLLDCGNETIVNDLILGKFRFAEPSDIVRVAYLKNCDDFITSSILKNHIELHSIENTIQSLTEVIFSNSDLKLLDYLIVQLKLKHEIDSKIFNDTINHIILHLNNQTVPIRLRRKESPEMKLKGLVSNGNLKILNYLLSNNFKFENLDLFNKLFYFSILEGNIQFINQLINKFGNELSIPLTHGNNINYIHFFIQFYLNKYHPKFKLTIKK